MSSIQQHLSQEHMLDDLFSLEFDNLLNPQEELLPQDAMWVGNEKPVDIKTFVEDKDFLGLKGRIYPAIMYSLQNIEREEIRESIMLLGKGSGKTTSLQIYMLYGMYLLLSMKNPQEYYELLPETPITTLLVSVSEKQAKSVGFAGIKSMIDRSPWFKGRYNPLSTEIRFEKHCTLFCGHSGATSWLGFNTVRAAMDETEYMTDSNNRSVARELYRALKGSLNTRFPGKYKMLCISSPKNEFSFLNQRFNMIKSEGTKLEVPTFERER